MDKLIAAIKELRINGSDEEERAFNAFKEKIIDEIMDSKQRLRERLEQLHLHDDGSTLRHCVLVAHDVAYVAVRLSCNRELAEKLCLDPESITDLSIAALLHDLGKIFIHPEILNNVPERELQEIWREQHGQSPHPLNLRTIITVRQIIEHRAQQLPSLFSLSPLSFFPRRHYSREMIAWFKKQNLEHFLDAPLFTYIQAHQNMTRRLLQECGVSEMRAVLAASHHPEYFSPEKRADLPPVCRIIEVVDKFNALIESEGGRAYHTTKRTRLQALDIIVQQLKQEFAAEQNDLSKRVELASLRELINRYLPRDQIEQEAADVLLLINRLAQQRRLSATLSDERLREDAQDALTRIAVILALSEEFTDFLSAETRDRLLAEERELEKALVWWHRA